MHVFIGTPCYGGQLYCTCAQSIMDVMNAREKYGVEVTVRFLPGESLITRGRNTIVAEFLCHPEYTHLFFVDADISFSADAFFRQVLSEHEVTGGVYPKKTIRPEKVISVVEKHGAGLNPKALIPTSLDYVVNASTSSIEVPKDRFVSVDYVGTGFMCIKRSAIEKLIEAYPERYRNDIDSVTMFEPNFYLLFDCLVDPKTRRYLSEDFAFCRKCLDIGIPIYADLLTPLCHTGTYPFQGYWLNSLSVSKRGAEQSDEPDSEPVSDEPVSDAETVSEPVSEPDASSID